MRKNQQDGSSGRCLGFLETLLLLADADSGVSTDFSSQALKNHLAVIGSRVRHRQALPGIREACARLQLV